MDRCDLLAECGFFFKHGTSSLELCQRFVACYCRGPLQLRCARRLHLKLHGSLPGDDMLPSGEQLGGPEGEWLPTPG